MKFYNISVLPEGFGNISSASMSLAVQHVLAQLYRVIEEAIAPVTDIITKHGVTAKSFGVTMLVNVQSILQGNWDFAPSFYL